MESISGPIDSSKSQGVSLREGGLPWIEKYRPNNLDELIDEGNKVGILRGLLKKGELPHMLFYGPPGTGKTSLILACVKEYYGENFIFISQYIFQIQLNMNFKKNTENFHGEKIAII